MNFSRLITDEIDGRFCYIKYDEFDLTMIKDNNYINATKLCKLGGKKFTNWIKLKESKELIKTVQEINNFWNIKPSMNRKIHTFIRI
ncbi:N1R/p28-like protein [Cheloniid poxvirus 1]|nr:N1R/p28-like protein [Cheloniid poxvirus 1]